MSFVHGTWEREARAKHSGQRSLAAGKRRARNRSQSQSQSQSNDSTTTQARWGAGTTRGPQHQNRVRVRLQETFSLLTGGAPPVPDLAGLMRPGRELVGPVVLQAEYQLYSTIVNSTSHARYILRTFRHHSWECSIICLSPLHSQPCHHTHTATSSNPPSLLSPSHNVHPPIHSTITSTTSI